MDKYINGVNGDLLYGNKEITSKDIYFKQEPEKEVKEEILILLNDIREININEDD